ncbi:MAG: DNA polymerase I [Bacteroidota bacterium]
MKKLFLLDAYALIFRAYYAFIKNPRISSKGLNTSAIFGFTNTILDVLNSEKPSHIAVVFDFPGPNFRNHIFSDYKANRQPTPEDIKISVPYIKQIIEAMNIPILQAEGFEGDDVIGTLAKKAEKLGFKVYMMTPDKDFMQLVSENVLMYKPKRSGNEAEIIGIDEVKTFFSIEKPEQVIDILGLMGDSVDNIPGAPGVGEKTAKKLISDFGSIEKLLENTRKLQGKLRENIENNVDLIKLSKHLATINLEAPVEIDENQLKICKVNLEKIKNIFDELEFRNLFPRMVQYSEKQSGENEPVDKSKSKKKEQEYDPSIHFQGSLFGDDLQPNVLAVANYDNISTIPKKYYLTETAEKRKDLISLLENQKEFCFDTETTSIDANIAEIVGISFSFKDHEGYYIPIPASKTEAENILAEFKTVFENPAIKKIGQNIKYDLIILKWYNIEVKGELFDTMIAHYLIQPEFRHNMDFLAVKYLNYSPVSIESLIGKKGKNQGNMRDVPVEKVKDYAAEDADITFQLKKILEKELKDNGLEKLYYEVEEPLIPVLAEMEKTGVKLNVGEINSFAVRLQEETLEVEKEIYNLAGIEFNISSPKQLGEILFDRLKIAAEAKMTKTKQYSTAEDVLVQFKDKHTIVEKILDYRSLKKLTSTYAEALPKLVNPKTGKIHTSFNQARVATGRLSSDNPNLQNIPIREERGREIRKSFIPSDNDHIFFSADYSQVELRLMAHLSKDENMIDAFSKGEDIHAATAAKINNISISEVSREMRSRAKSANFGIIYGVSAFGLAQNLNVSRTEAKKLIDNYFETYPKVKLYMDESIRIARDRGYVETIFGRRRMLSDINSRNQMVRGMAERNAINAPIQGSAADIIKIAMAGIFKKFEENNLKSKMILQVHDELNFDVFKPELEKVKEIVVFEMQNAVKLSVPLTVDIGIGNNWLEAH